MVRRFERLIHRQPIAADEIIVGFFVACTTTSRYDDGSLGFVKIVSRPKIFGSAYDRQDEVRLAGGKSVC